MITGVRVEGSRPYAWPFDGELPAERVALVVAGADTRWRGRCADPVPAERVMRALAGPLRTAGALVVAVRCPQPWTQGEPGEDAGPEADVWVTAGGLDGFFGSRLDRVLRAAGRDRLALCGFGLEGPVHSTLRSANDRGYECVLLTDACAELRPELRHAAIETITMSGGIFGAVAPSAAFLDAVSPGAEL
ncbi:MAG: isochorismatase family protein [Thermoleophilia bacterium]